MSKVNPQINLSKKPKKDGGTGSYESGGTTFTVIKNDTGLPKGFFRHVHKPLNGPITLDRTLATSGDQIRGGFLGRTISSIDNATEVSVYYWDGNDNVPILLGITTENGNPEKTKYHGRSGPGNPWMNGFVLSLSEKQALDNQNCHNNNTVVFNIQNPEFGTLNENSKISNCIRGKIKTSYIKLPSLPGSNYTIKEYAINGDASISRVTYGGRSTGITLNKGGGIDKVRVYFSAGSIEVPLLVEFLQRGGGESEWHYTQNTDGRNWTEVGKEKSKTFYSGPDQPTENLTTELDQIACSIGIGVTLDISYRNSETHARQSKKYCCDNHKDRVTVASGKINTGNHGHIMYYQHTIGQRYNLAAIKYHENSGDQRRIVKLSGPHFPISNVQSVYVFYCSEEKPVLMYVDSTSITAKGWYKKGTGYYDPWIWIGGISSIKPTDIDKKNISCDKWTKLNEVFKNHGCSTLGSCPQNLTVTNPTRYQGEPDEETERKKALDQLQAEQKKEKEELAKRIANDDDDLKPQQRSIQQPPISSPTLPDSGQLATELLSPEGSPPAPAAVPSAQPQIQLPHKVTIKLSEKPEGNPHTKEYKGSSSSDKLIKVELTSYPEKGFTQDFLKYTHSPEDNKPFKLAQVLDDRNQTVIRANGDHITSVEAYYWTGNTEKALLVGVTANSGTTYYRNSRNSTWTKHNIKSDGKPTKEELDLLNCEINGVVQIDVTNIPDYDHTETTYCHNDQDTVDKHVKKKVKVSEIPGSSKHLGNYTAYSHTPNPKTHYGINLNTFNISCFTKNDKTITLSGLHLPIMGANKVIVYFCKGEVNVIRSSGKSVNNPLLIYLPNSDQGERWFKKHYSSNEWIPVDQLNGKECFDNAVVDFLDTLESICRPPEVTINIYNRTIGNTYAYGDDFGRWITVNGGEVVGASGFIEYTHTISGSTSYFTLQNVNYTDKPTSGILDITSNKSLKYVDRVSVYYWRPLEDPARKGNPDERGRPLIIKVTAHTPGGPEKSTYYENAGTGTTDNGKWKLWTPLGFPLRPMELENKLELLNCDLNQVVSIDVNKTKGSYCGHRHNVHKKVSVSQVPDPNSQFGRYKAFEHIPNLKAYTGNSGSTHTFHISEFTSGQDKALTGLPTPLIDVSSITVYFCGKDTRSGRGTNPLLIYIDSNDPRITGNKWFQSDDRGMTWKPVDFPPSNDQTYETILDILDNVRNECQPPSVTVDIYHRDLGGHTKYYEYDSGSKRKILVMYVRDNSPGFTEYRHAIAGGIPFTVNEFRYNKPTTEGLESPMYRVTTVSVFYWTALEDTKDDQERNRPLLVKVTTIEPTSKLKKEIYYENKGIDGDLNWVPTSVDTGNLEKKLRLLNCKLNSAVIIDVGKTGNTGYYDACKEEDKKLDNGHASDRMTVNKDPTPGDQSLENYQVYKHALNNGGGKFHIVKFINGNNSRETLKGISPLPILDVDQVKVYFCPKGPSNPLLIYYYTPGGSPEHKWYKNENPDDKNGSWKVVTGFIQNTYNRGPILTVPNGLSLCAQSTSANAEGPGSGSEGSPPTLAPTSTTSSPPGTTTPKAAAANRGGGETSQTNSSDWKVIFGGSASATVVSGSLTGFGWWMFKRSKGDPWVRQI